MFEVDGEQYEIKEYEVPLVDQTMFLLETLREKKVCLTQFKIKQGTIPKNIVMQIKKRPVFYISFPGVSKTMKLKYYLGKISK